MDIEVSVVIPVYNVEHYILECIESVKKQSFKNMEILIIDDGSKDKSIDIVEKVYDKRIKIITQPNGGLSAARNTGIMNSKGKYILFLDSDDYLLNTNAIYDMYKSAESYNSDIVVGNATKVYDNGKKVEFYRNKKIFFTRTIDSTEFLKEFIKFDSMQIPVWMNLYRRELLLKNKILFKEGILHEDELFTPQVFLKADRVTIYPNTFYGYRQRENSIMTSDEKNDKRCKDILNICEELDKIYLTIDDKDLVKYLSKKTKWLIWNTINTNNLKKISWNLNLFLIKNSRGIKEFTRSFIVSINIKLYKKVIGIK